VHIHVLHPKLNKKRELLTCDDIGEESNNIVIMVIKIMILMIFLLYLGVRKEG
jgi:hypothetical protein